jgi:UDP-GlcNAc:undecaprenyl-phosphate/decaprenyl-phosphate GlcNAc-1-phosphate transferase
MWHSVLPFAFALPASLLTTAATIRVAQRKGWLVHPRADRWSRASVAKFGGVSVLLIFSLAVVVFRGSKPLLTITLLTAAMGLVGLVDDIFQLRPGWKFAAQFVIAAIAVWSGIVYQLFHVASLNYAFTFLWILGVTNALNLLDNMDGLAAGVSVIAACSLLLIEHSSGPLAIGLLAMAGSLLGFLVFNFHPAKIFMGDTGSLATGFFLACCAVSQAGHVSAMFSIVFVPGLVLFLPIFDMLLVSVTRRLNGRAISAGAKDHTSHRLVMLGLSERNAVLTLYLLAALSALVAVLCKRVWSDIGPGILAFFLLTAAAFWFYLAKIQLPEEWLSRTNALTFFIPEFLNSVGKRAAMVFADAGLIVLAEFLGYLLRFDGVPHQYLSSFLWAGVFLIVVKIPLFAIFSVYRRDWTIRALRDLYPILKGSVFGSMLVVTALTYMTGFKDFSRAVFATEMVLTVCLMGFVRTVTRFFDDVLPKQTNEAYLVIGGPSAEFFYRYFEWQRLHGNIVAFVAPVMNGNAFLYGVPVVPLSRMSTFLSKVTAVYLLPDCPEPARLTVMQSCDSENIPVRALQLSVETLPTGEFHRAAVAS